MHPHLLCRTFDVTQGASPPAPRGTDGAQGAGKASYPGTWKAIPRVFLLTVKTPESGPEAAC